MRLTHRTLWIILLIALVAACAGSQNIPPQTHRVTLLHFNDPHGYLQPHPVLGQDQPRGGAARMATLINRIRQENDDLGVPTIVLSSGDLLTGSPLSAAYQGEADIKVFNLMGLNATTVGNHDFDFGQDNFNRLVKQSYFPWVVTNLRRDKHDSPWLPLAMTKHYADGLNVMLIGVTSPELTTGTHPRNMRDLVVDDPGQTLQRALRRASPDTLVVVLSHCGIATDTVLAKAVSEIDVIIGGHNGNLYEQPVIVDNKIIVQAGEYLENLGRLDLEITGEQVKLVRYKIYPITADLAEEPKIKSLVDGYLNRLAESQKEVIGEALVDFDGRREIVRRTESNLGDFICDVVRNRFQAEVVLLNSGGIRDSLKKGPITAGDVQKIQPFANTLVTLTVPGRVLREALERGLQENPEDNPGSFLQVSGLTYVIDGRKATQIMVGGQPLAEDRPYKLVINDFMAAGGDRFEMFKNYPDKLDSGYGLADLLMEYIKERKQISAQADQRIKRINPW